MVMLGVVLQAAAIWGWLVTGHWVSRGSPLQLRTGKGEACVLGMRRFQGCESDRVFLVQRPIVEWSERRRSLLIVRLHGGDLGSRESTTDGLGVGSGMTVME